WRATSIGRKSDSSEHLSRLHWFARPGDPLAAQPLLKRCCRRMRRYPYPFERETAQQIRHIGLIAIMMRQASVRVVSVRALINEGVRFDFAYMAGSDFGTLVGIVR